MLSSSLKISSEDFWMGVTWYEDYYDGPLSGVIEYKNKQYYFSCMKETSRNRVYGIYDLIDSEWEIVNERHREFCMYVGSYYSFKNGVRFLDGPYSRDGWDLYYNKYPPRSPDSVPVLTNRKPICYVS